MTALLSVAQCQANTISEHTEFPRGQPAQWFCRPSPPTLPAHLSTSAHNTTNVVQSRHIPGSV